MHGMELTRTPQRKKRTPIIFLLLIFVLLSIALMVFVIIPKPSKEQIPYFSETNPLIYKGEVWGSIHRINEDIYIPLAFFENHLPDLFFPDKQTDSYILATSADVIQLFPDQTSFSINGMIEEVQRAPIIIENNQPYVSLHWLENYYPISYQAIEKAGVWLLTDGETLKKGIVSDKKASVHNLRLRSEASVEFPYYAEVKPGETVIIEEETEDYYFVRKENGIAGYLKKKIIAETNNETIKLGFPREIPVAKEAPSPIHLTWEAVYSVNPRPDQLPHMPGVNVVSPTWFHINDSEGNLKDLASKEYVQWAKERGYQIWGLFSNDFDPELTHEALSHFTVRKKIIDQLLQFCEEYELDGINFDIENVNLEDGPLVTQFMKEASSILHQHNLIVSMDITFISTSENWSMFYEREKLKDIVDYLIVMAYDEHTSGMGIAGSVSSLPWVEGNLQRLLEIVPPEKLVLGIPFYTRLWEEKINDNGEKEVTSQALTMNQALNWIEENNLNVIYDQENGQNYVEMKADDGTVYKMWLEDATSLRKRAELARKYNLAGLAAWSRYFANDEAWAFLNEFYIQGSTNSES